MRMTDGRGHSDSKRGREIGHIATQMDTLLVQLSQILIDLLIEIFAASQQQRQHLRFVPAFPWLSHTNKLPGPSSLPKSFVLMAPSCELN